MIVKHIQVSEKLKKGIYHPVSQPVELIQERSSFQRHLSADVPVSKYNSFFEKLPF